MIPLLILLKRYMAGGKNEHWPELSKETICIITGSNTGLGYINAEELAKLGATVIFACRSEERAKKAM